MSAKSPLGFMHGVGETFQRLIEMSKYSKSLESKRDQSERDIKLF